MESDILKLTKLEELTRKICLLIAEYFEDEGNRARALCWLAISYQADPATFAGLLMSCGLRACRASEIKAVLLAPEICQQFINDQLKWKGALEKARDDGSSAEQRVAALLVRRLLKHAPLWTTGTTCDGWSFDSVAPNQEYVFRGPGGVLRIVFSSHPTSTL